MRFLDLFVDREAVKEANAQFKADIAAINEREANRKEEFAVYRKVNKQNFRDRIAKATAERKAANALADSNR